MKTAPRNSLFISFDGADGLGKSTQVAMLISKLVQSGIRVSEFDFPHKDTTPIGELIGSFLRGKFGDVVPEFLGLSFSLDRFASRKALLEGTLRGEWVICDRYVLSNIAFQGAKIEDAGRRHQLEAMLDWVEYSLLDLPRPDLEIVVMAHDEYFEDRHHLMRDETPNRAYISGEKDIHEQSIDLQIKVNRFFRTLKPHEGLKFISIHDNDLRRRTPEDLHEEIWSYVMPLFTNEDA